MRVLALLFIALASAQERQLADLSLDELIQVHVRTAALHQQDQRDAPANVTVITADDIRRFGFRTLAEALSYCRGFYVTYDHTYHYAGIRGFSLPGDFSTRILVLINGHNIVSSVDNSASAFGQDFPVDLRLVEQIEIIRGPSSALYGSNGMFATINVVTRDPKAASPFVISAETASLGEKKLQVSGKAPIAGGTLMLSASVLNNAGEKVINFVEYNPGEQVLQQQAINVDGEKGYHLFANFESTRWNLLAVLSGREKIQPLSWTDTLLNDPGTRISDVRGFFESRYERDVKTGHLTWRTYYDASRFKAIYHTLKDDGVVEDSREAALGDWLGTQVIWRQPVGPFGTVTASAEMRYEFRTLARQDVVQPSIQPRFYVNRPDHSAAVFVQDELALNKQVKVNVGVRLDDSANHGRFISPRATLVYQPSKTWDFKILYGRAFRDPSVYEMFFDDGFSGIANLAARPEHLDSYELVAERHGPRSQFSLSAYYNSLDDLLAPVYVTEDIVQFQNNGKEHAQGVEAEYHVSSTRGFSGLASVAVQHVYDARNASVLPNSPGVLAKAQGVIPIRHLDLSAGLQYMSERRTSAGASLVPVIVADMTLASRRLKNGFDLQVGIRNLFNRHYDFPIGLESVTDTMHAPARTWFLGMSWRKPD